MSDLRLIGGDLLPPRSERRHLISIADLRAATSNGSRDGSLLLALPGA